MRKKGQKISYVHYNRKALTAESNISLEFFIVSSYNITQMNSKNIQLSEEFSDQQPIKAKYSKTTMKKKQQLVDFVVNKKYSIYKACKKLKISNSTAKSILNNFEKHGVLLQRNTRSKLQEFQKNSSEVQNVEQRKEIKEQAIIQNMPSQELDYTQSLKYIQNINSQYSSVYFSYPFAPFYCQSYNGI